jgi:hypothetical protein
MARGRRSGFVGALQGLREHRRTLLQCRILSRLARVARTRSSADPVSPCRVRTAHRCGRIPALVVHQRASRGSLRICATDLLCCTLKRRSGAQAEPRRHQPANLSWSAPEAHIIAPRQIKAKNDLKVLKYVEPKAPMVSSPSTGRDQNA